MQRGDLFLASFPFGDVVDAKVRPVLLLTGRVGIGTEVLVAYMSSVVPSSLLKTDVLIDPSSPEHQSTKLKKASVLRLHKLATIHVTSLKRHLGALPNATLDTVSEKLKAMLGV